MKVIVFVTDFSVVDRIINQFLTPSGPLICLL